MPRLSETDIYTMEVHEIDSNDPHHFNGKHSAVSKPAVPSQHEFTINQGKDVERDQVLVQNPFHEEDLTGENDLDTAFRDHQVEILTSKIEEVEDDSTNERTIDVRSLAIGLPPIPSIPSIPECITATTTMSSSMITTTISLESLPPIPLPQTQVDTVASQGLPLLSSKRRKARCKQANCGWYGNVAYGGYCSDCFFYLTIVDNSVAVEPPFNSKQLQNQLCLGRGCEFFGATEFEGYCSHCHSKQKNVGEPMSHTTSGWCSDDMKMCIICLQLPYNTVLLPCGHLYLCYRCALSIKNKNGTCPACRTTIQSFHRVYTPD